MAWLDRLRKALRREATDVRESWGELATRADAELARRERDLEATPQERLDATQQEIADAGDPFAEVRRKLEAMRRAEPGDDER